MSHELIPAFASAYKIVAYLPSESWLQHFFWFGANEVLKLLRSVPDPTFTCGSQAPLSSIGFARPSGHTLCPLPSSSMAELPG